MVVIVPAGDFEAVVLCLRKNSFSDYLAGGSSAAIELLLGPCKKHTMLPTKCRPDAIETGLQVTLLDDPAGK